MRGSARNASRYSGNVVQVHGIGSAKTDGGYPFVVGGSLYKVTQWWHYRHDPVKREQAASLSQVYPARLRRFFYDEEADKVKKD